MNVSLEKRKESAWTPDRCYDTHEDTGLEDRADEKKQWERMLAQMSGHENQTWLGRQ